jgi:long-chain acyl-CoA synthetase
MLSMGASMGLNSDVSKLIDELAEVKPTILLAVPRIFNRIYDGVNKQMSERGGLVESLFRSAIKIAGKIRDGQPVGAIDRAKLAVADKIIFTKVRGRFGGRLKYAMSGGAALSKDVAQFIDSLGIMVFEGYGLTETSPIASANYPNNRKIGSVGKPISEVTFEIDASVLERGEDDRKAGPVQGEIVVSGPNIMQGYHKREDENAAVLFAHEPYPRFRTGDMGYIDADGFVWITGRIKEQYKLTNGKYVVPAPLEEELKLSPLIANIMIHGANKPYNVALIVADPDSLKKVAGELGVSGSPDDLVKNERVKARFKDELEKYSASFKKFDRVEKFALITEDFSTQNDMLTPSLKLKRRNVLKKWSDLIESLY